MLRVKKHFWIILVILYFLGISSVYALMSVVKHSHYGTLGDLGIFNQGIWQYSRLIWPIISFHLNGPFLGDHFHPIVAFLAPFYWLWPREETLLVLQPFVMLSAIIPLYLISRKLTKSVFFSLAVILGYSFYIPLQYTIFYDFHEIVFLPPLFAWAYYFFINKKKFLTAFFLFLCLLVKEEVGFFVATFGLYLLIFKKNWRLFGLAWLISGIGWSLAMIYWVIPGLAGAPYRYFVLGDLGKTPIEIIRNIATNPKVLIDLMTNSEIKLDTMYRTFYPFGFLPLGSIFGLVMSYQQLFFRFMSSQYPTRWTLAYHYSAPMAIIVSIASIETASVIANTVKQSSKRLPRFLRSLAMTRFIFIFLGILIILFTRLDQINRSAVLLIKRQIFWDRAPYMDSLDKAIKLIPPNASVAAQNNLISHVSTRQKVWTIRDIDKGEYLLFDFHQGQSSYNFLGQEIWDKYEKIIKDAIKTGKYKVVFNEGEVYLLTINP